MTVRGGVVLLTGFEPYGGGGANPSAEVVTRLDGREIDGARVVGRTMPVHLRDLSARIEDLMAELDPVAVVSLGLWPGEPMIRLERVALNVADFAIPDNEGALLQDAPIEANAATARLATLPLRAMERALLAAGIPAQVSNTAGTFLCNATMYAFLSAIEAKGRDLPCGFVHLPCLPAQVAELLVQTHEARAIEVSQRDDLASMDLDTQTRAVEICLKTCLAG